MSHRAVTTAARQRRSPARSSPLPRNLFFQREEFDSSIYSSLRFHSDTHSNRGGEGLSHPRERAPVLLHTSQNSAARGTAGTAGATPSASPRSPGATLRPANGPAGAAAKSDFDPLRWLKGKTAPCVESATAPSSRVRGSPFLSQVRQASPHGSRLQAKFTSVVSPTTSAPFL